MNLPKLPKDPGCYLYRDKAGKIIYIGKAKNLNNRIRSYFSGTHDPKTKELVKHIESVDFIITDTEAEALILESNLVKKHQPKYNIDLKDAKGFAYIKITNEEFPRLVIARGKPTSKKGEGLFGPFTNAAARDFALHALRKAFGIRTCSRMPKKPCLKKDMGLCSAPCVGNIKQGDYITAVRQAEAVLLGKSEELSEQLSVEMMQASENKDFERAILLRERISAIKSLSERQKMERRGKHNEDVIFWELREGLCYLLLFNVRKGILEAKQEFVFPAIGDFFDSFLFQFYSDAKDMPKELILQKSPETDLETVLKGLKGSKVRITVPKTGVKKKLLDLARANLEASFFSGESSIAELKDAIGLKTVPEVIECFDISHLGGTETVASMVSFLKGKPNKTAYRRFKIRETKGVDDFKSISEVVSRRYSRLLKENSNMPDLILIDGGKGQLSSADSALKELSLDIPLASIAKREEEIFIRGQKEPIILPMKSKALHLLQSIRDEAHRFAINYQKKRRDMQMKEEFLEL